MLLANSIRGSYGQVAKISDFGLSAMLLNGATHRSTASLGTITHMVRATQFARAAGWLAGMRAGPACALHVLTLS